MEQKERSGLGLLLCPVLPSIYFLVAAREWGKEAKRILDVKKEENSTFDGIFMVSVDSAGQKLKEGLAKSLCYVYDLSSGSRQCNRLDTVPLFWLIPFHGPF